MLASTTQSGAYPKKYQVADIFFEVNSTGKVLQFMAQKEINGHFNCDTAIYKSILIKDKIMYDTLFVKYDTLQNKVEQTLKGVVSSCTIALSETQSIQIHLRPQRDKNGLINTITGVGFDISEKVLQEKKVATELSFLRNYNQDLERFAYIASHDLHEPLRMIGSFLGLLKEEYQSVLDEEANSYINFAVDGAKRLQKLIDDLLFFNRLGKPNLKKESFDLNDAIQIIQYQLRDLVSEKKATIELQNINIQIFGNFKQITILLYHLLENALLFSKQPKISINCEHTSKNWLIIVKDNGIGIAPVHHEKVFEVFFKHCQPDKERTGIGLAICKKIILQHGGQIWLDSEKEKGTDVYCTLPT